jgi:Cdc6-like AAA superfamily ATPase
VNPAEKEHLRLLSGRAFSPSAPIDKRDLFAGRIQQLRRVADAVNTRGQHAIIFGERGVGKTSLANILKDTFASQELFVIKVNCDQDDTFGSLWQKALSEIEIVERDEGIGFRPRVPATRRSLAEELPEQTTPDAIRRILQHLGESVLIFDEFDRIQDMRTQRLLADTIKNLSDNSIPATLVLVGVATDVDDLIAEHASIDRALVQIQMPRMNAGELEEIVNKGLNTLGMTIERAALDLIVLLSQGLPHYTHLLGQASARDAIENDHRTISVEDVTAGLKSALELAQQSIRNAYQEAVASQRKGSLFRQVLLACALAEGDELGYFGSADVREPLSRIMGRRYEIPGFSQHLDKFTERNRGPVLEKAGTSRRFRFRFINPLLQPYVIMRGLAEGMLDGDLIDLLRREHSDRTRDSRHGCSTAI